MNSENNPLDFLKRLDNEAEEAQYRTERGM